MLKPKSGHLYVIRCMHSEFAKVGITTLSPSKRINQLSTGCPFILQLTYSLSVSDMALAELYIHEKLSDYRIRGEWFTLKTDASRRELLKSLRNVGKPCEKKCCIGKTLVGASKQLASKRWLEIANRQFR